MVTSRTWCSLIGLLLIVVSSPDCFGQSSRDFKPRVLLSPRKPIVDAPVIPAAEATAKVVVDNELVLGVVVAGEARAYPINMLTGPSREIINDELGGQAIAATW